MTDHPETRFIVYGSLAPGGANAFHAGGPRGEWHPCRIRGRLGTYPGFKSFRYDPQGPEHPAWLLESTDLPRIIPDLDDFEGEAYKRLVIPAKVDGRWVMAQVYERQVCRLTLAQPYQERAAAISWVGRVSRPTVILAR